MSSPAEFNTQLSPAYGSSSATPQSAGAATPRGASSVIPQSTSSTPRGSLSTPILGSTPRGSLSTPILGSTPRGARSAPKLTSSLDKRKIKNGDFVIAAKQNATAPCWKTFGVVRHKPQHQEDDQEEDGATGAFVDGFAVCKGCGQVYAYNSRTTEPNSLSRHNCPKAIPTKPKDQPGISDAMAAAARPVITKEAKTKVARATAHFVARDLRAYTAVEGDGMAVLAAELIKFGQANPKVKVTPKLVKELLPTRNTVKNHVKLVDLEAKAEMKKKLNDAVVNRTAAFTTDQWTDDYKKLLTYTYTDLTCYIIDDDFQLQQYTLACRGFPTDEPKSGENIHAALCAILKDFNVNEEAAKKCFFTTDFGSSIISGLNTFYGDKEYPTNLRQGCLAHRINTILRTAWTNTEAILDSSKNFDTNVKQLVQYSKQSSLQGKLEKTLKKGSTTRWNSFYYTLASIKTSYAAIEDNLRGTKDFSRLTCIDRLLLDQLTAFLEHFKDMTDTVEAEQEPTIQHVVLAYYSICSLCEPDTEDDLVVLQFKAYILQLLSDKIKIKDYHWIAVFLDPRYRDLLMFDSEEDTNAKRLEIETNIKSIVGAAPVDASADVDGDVEELVVPSLSKRKRDCFNQIQSCPKSQQQTQILDNGTGN